MARQRSILCGIASGLLAIASISTCLGAGVTVITHGWQLTPGSPVWLDHMADFIGLRASEAIIPGDHMGYTWYHATIENRGIIVPEPALIRFEKADPLLSDPDDVRSGEIIITVDWSDVANHTAMNGIGVTTDEIAELIRLLLTNSFPSEAINHPLAEFPIHLIGHSRGGSVVSELARMLGEGGIWVEQVTTLDPHPLHWPDTGVIPLGVSPPDPEIELHRNTVYADNFWRQDTGPISLGDFNGQHVATARNLQLDENLLGGDEVINDPGYAFEHLDVHLWYYGTIDTVSFAFDGEELVPQDWWTSQQERELSGFFYSRIGSGSAQRSSVGFTYAHYPPSGDMPSLLYSRPLPSTVGLQRPNIDHLELISDYSTAIEIGSTMAIRFHYQDRDSSVTINWHLDPDTNPYNGNETLLSTTNMGTTGESVLLRTNGIPVSGIAENLYFVFAEISGDNDGFKRYDYLPNRLAFSNSPPPVPTPAITSVSPNSLPGLPLPQTQELTVTGTGFLPQSKLEFSDSTTTYPNRVPTYISPTELRYNIRVGNVSANWTVKVLNGSLESNLGSFIVTATPDATAPPAPANVTFAFAGGVGDDFYYVDWTDPADASGLAKIWWKLGSPPTAPNDGVGFALPDLKPLPVSTLTTNPQTLYLWLEDGAGNKDHNHRASILLFRDTGAPFVVTPPPDRTVIEGASAVFSVTAGGAAPLGYQWQKNGVNVPGATLPTYATPPVTLADNNAQFRVIITNAFGAVTSSWATLTVNTANTITWTGAVSSDWNNPTNWSPQTVPTASDRVVIDSGLVNVWQASFAVLDWNSGTLEGTFTNEGTLNWSAGELRGELKNAVGAVVNIAGAADKVFNRWAAVRNDGVINWSGGNLSLVNGYYYDTAEMSLENRAGAVFNLLGDGSTSLAGGSGWWTRFVLTNAGLIRKSASFGTNVFANLNFYNAGTVEVQSGTLSFAGAAFNNTFTNVGTCRVLSGATLQLAAGWRVGNYEQAATASMGGRFEIAQGAAMRLVSGSFMLSAELAPSESGFFGVCGPVSLYGTLSAPNFELVSGGNIYGNSRFTIIGTMTWSGGEMGGQLTVSPGSALNIIGSGTKTMNDSRGAITNAGTVTWIDTGNLAGRVFHNRPTGLFDIRTDSTNSWWQSILNEGTLRKSAATNTVGFGYCTNTGTVEVQNGTLSLALDNNGMCRVGTGATLALGGGTVGGTFDVAQGSAVNLAGSFTLKPELVWTGAGLVQVTGVAAFYGLMAIPNVYCSSGGIGGDFTNAGTLNWSGGSLSAALTLAPSGVLNISGNADKTMDYANITNQGTVLWTGSGQIRARYQVVFHNHSGGLFDIQSDATCDLWSSPSSLVVNAGTMRKSGGTGVTHFDHMPFHNGGIVEAETGTLWFHDGYTQTAGATRLAGGEVKLTGPQVYLNGGRLSGNGVVSAAVVNAAEVIPGGSPGTLTINGSYTQTTAGKLTIEIGGLSPGSQHDRLVVNGPVTLDGALQVSFTNGFVAGTGDFFNVLSYASRSGAFASSTAGALGLTESYTPTGLVLVAGSNAYPSLSFTVSGGNTQTVCVPFQLQAAAADVDGALTNVTILLDGSPLASAPDSPLTAQAEIDFPALYNFTARAQDNQGGTTWATQSVALVTPPLHVLTAGFRTNGAFKLCLLGETDASYQLLASTNLGSTNWTVIGVMENTNGIWRYLDAGATNQAWRFYRARQVP